MLSRFSAVVVLLVGIILASCGTPAAAQCPSVPSQCGSPVINNITILGAITQSGSGTNGFAGPISTTKYITMLGASCAGGPAISADGSAVIGCAATTYGLSGYGIGSTYDVAFGGATSGVAGGITPIIAIMHNTKSVALGGVGTTAVAANATSGFIYLPAFATIASSPTGTPNTVGSFGGTMIPIIFDPGNGKMWAYYGAAWHYVSFT